jgi:hypothetical protein
MTGFAVPLHAVHYSSLTHSPALGHLADEKRDHRGRRPARPATFHRTVRRGSASGRGSSRRRLALSAARRTETASQRRHTASSRHAQSSRRTPGPPRGHRAGWEGRSVRLGLRLGSAAEVARSGCGSDGNRVRELRRSPQRRSSANASPPGGVSTSREYSTRRRPTWRRSSLPGSSPWCRSAR